MKKLLRKGTEVAEGTSEVGEVLSEGVGSAQGVLEGDQGLQSWVRFARGWEGSELLR